MNVNAAIKELEKIEMVKQSDQIYRLSHALTKTQKTILKAFDMDARTIKKEVNEISKLLEKINKNA